MVLDTWCTEPYKTQWFCILWWGIHQKIEKMMEFVVGLQFLLTPWLLSTWFGDWLASQSPNPSWQHRVSLKHLQNTVILCHFVSLVCMLCHMGGWDMVCRHLAFITHNLLNSDKTHGIIYNSGVGAVGLTSSKKSDFANQNLCDGGLPHTGWCLSTCFFWKNGHSKAWKVWTTKLPN